MAAKGEASELEAYEHGIFTYWFVVKGINEDKADTADNPHLTDDDYIPFEEAYDYAFHQMKMQKPNIVDKLTDDLLPMPETT